MAELEEVIGYLPEEEKREVRAILEPVTKENCLDFFQARSLWMKIAWVIFTKRKLPSIGPAISEGHAILGSYCLRAFGVAPGTLPYEVISLAWRIHEEKGVPIEEAVRMAIEQLR